MRKIYKIKISILLISMLSFYSKAQDNTVNLDKYWHYRYRLTNHFMVVGDCQGCSIPAGIRNFWNGGTLHWGDAPLYLGWYIGVLATEYRLLKDNNQPTGQTLMELYYALKAVERLDKKAEAHSPWNKQEDLNGFLIRDDVPLNFITLHPELNYLIPNPNSYSIQGTGDVGLVTTVMSDDDSKTPAFSQDHVYHLLMGYALVKKYVDSGVLTFTGYINGVASTHNEDLKQMAMDETDRMMNYIKINSVRSLNAHWKILDPEGSSVTGGVTWDFAQGFAKAGEYITGIDYTDNYSSVIYGSLWQQNQFNTFIRSSNTLLHMILVLAAISDSWYDNAENTTKQGIAFQGDYDAGSLYFDNHFGWDQFYGLLHRLLYDYDISGDPLIDICKVQGILNSAPADGPFFHQSSSTVLDLAPDGWANSFRFIGNPPQQNTGKLGFQGNYNGLDYMLLHNLYQLANKGGQAIVSGTYPIPIGVGIGSTVNPLTVSNPYKEILVKNLISTEISPGANTFYGDVIINGGPQGVLLDNVTVTEGAILEINASDNSGCSVSPQGYVFNYYYGASNQKKSDFELNDFADTSNSNLSISDGKLNLFSISPNPSNGAFLIQTGTTEAATIYIYDVLGNIIYQTTATGAVNIDISTHAKGIYFVKVITGSGVIANEKIIYQ